MKSNSLQELVSVKLVLVDYYPAPARTTSSITSTMSEQVIWFYRIYVFQPAHIPSSLKSKKNRTDLNTSISSTLAYIKHSENISKYVSEHHMIELLGDTNKFFLISRTSFFCFLGDKLKQRILIYQPFCHHIKRQMNY